MYRRSGHEETITSANETRYKEEMKKGALRPRRSVTGMGGLHRSKQSERSACVQAPVLLDLMA